MLTLKHITKSIAGKTILNDLSLTVRRGEIAVLLGASGVGKSTLLRILNHLETPETIDTGIIELDGATLSPETINRQHTVGMVFQQFNLFEHLTVQENITLALEKVLHYNSAGAQDIALTLLQHYGLADKATSSVTRLSGGQKQRLAIARTVALKPTVICFDEPTSALDPLLTAHVAASIQELADQNYIVLVATHDVGILEKMNCTIHLIQNGSIIESTQSKDFFKNTSDYPRIAAFMRGQHTA